MAGVVAILIELLPHYDLDRADIASLTGLHTFNLLCIYRNVLDSDICGKSFGQDLRNVDRRANRSAPSLNGYRISSALKYCKAGKYIIHNWFFPDIDCIRIAGWLL